MKMLLFAAFALTLTGCISLGGDKQPATYEEAIHKEVAELLKSYRLCLQKNEEAPQKARDNCAPYHEAIVDLAPPDTRHSVGAFLDRLLSRERRQSAER